MAPSFAADLVFYSSRFLCSKAALAQTAVSQASIACRLDKGQFPATRDDLDSQGMTNLSLDVVTGQPMKYRRTPDGRFVLYSIGWNEKDDNGKPSSICAQKPRIPIKATGCGRVPRAVVFFSRRNEEGRSADWHWRWNDRENGKIPETF
jgi:hypothetical protein